MHLLHRRSSLWVVLNVVGMATYLKLASALWVQPGEEGTPGGPGDAFYWLFLLLPLLVAFLVLNSAALFVLVRRIRVSKGKAPLAIWLAIATLWAATVAFDHHRSLRVIDAQSGSLPRVGLAWQTGAHGSHKGAAHSAA